MKFYRIAILGATGAVGQEMLRVLEERNFPVETLLPLASSRSAGATITFRGRQIPVEAATAMSFEGTDIVLGAAENEIALAMAPAIRQAGAIFVDNSSAFRLNPDVPLVVAEVNPEDIKRHNGTISNPNCTTIITLTAVNPLNALSPIRSMVVSTYQAVSGAGAGGPAELLQQTQALSRGQECQSKVFPYQIAYNLIPQIGSAQAFGYTSEAMKRHYEGRKILHNQDLKVSCTCVRVPVVRSHSVSVRLTFDHPVSVSQARAAIANAPGCKLLDDLDAQRYPMPLDTSGQDLVFVGRIRQDMTDANSLNLWCCGDQLRKGAATNAVEIAQLLIK
jgi:aspartate-semialdehyde dehydrogenase